MLRIVIVGHHQLVEVKPYAGDGSGGAAAWEIVNYTGMGSTGEPPMSQE